MRILILGLVLLFGWLQYRLWAGEGSLAELHAIKADIAHHRQDLAELRARNQVLAAEVLDLKTGQAALEERARADLGMIRQGEVFIQVIDEPAGPAPEPLPDVLGPAPAPKKGTRN